MYNKKIFLSENYYNLIINENLKSDAVAYIQKSNYITIIYENNIRKNQSYLNTYPIKLLTHKIYDKLKNLLNEKNTNLKYILFKNDNKESLIKFKDLINQINTTYCTNIEVSNYEVYYSLYNTIINPHYDRVDRYILQIKGEKKILLLEPKYIKNFKEYPLLHPANRNFQIKSINDNTEIKNNIKEFHLKEGDCLFIPKYWIHEISTEDESMSLVFALKNKDIQIVSYYEFGKEIDNCLFQIGGMDIIFEWNKLWLYSNDEDLKLTKKYEDIYNMLSDYLINKYPNNITFCNIKKHFKNHAQSYRIFFENNINIPNY